jgi:hypothetical protein
MTEVAQMPEGFTNSSASRRDGNKPDGRRRGR